MNIKFSPNVALEAIRAMSTRSTRFCSSGFVSAPAEFVLLCPVDDDGGSEATMNCSLRATY